MEKRYKLVNFCEFDKYASKSYCAIHGVDESLNLGDITKVDETKLKPFNMIVGGSPCQDFSVAGKQKGSVWKCKNEECKHEYNPLTVHFSQRHKCPKCGSEELDKSRSSLLVEWLRLIRANKPKFGIYENVKNIVGKEFKETTFKLFEQELNEYGYNTYWKVLNAKDYGVPQNRERVFLLLIKKELDNGKFEFPVGFDCGIRLKHILEEKVEEKYYISNEKAKTLIESLKNKNSLLLDMCQAKREGKPREYSDFSPTLSARDYKEPRLINEINMVGLLDIKGNEQVRRVYGDDGLSPTLNTMQGGNRQPKVLEGMCIDDTQSFDGVRCYREIAPTLRSQRSGLKVYQSARIRKLTPKECFRLMGFSDSDFGRCKEVGVSDSQLYKQAGNSIVTMCLYYILRNLYISMSYLFDDLALSSYFSGIGAFEKALDMLYEDIDNDVNFTQPQEN